MTLKIILLIFLILITSFAQNIPFNENVNRFQINFYDENYWQMLEQNNQADIDLAAQLIINDTLTLDSIGIRFKGNSSFNNPYDKKPFNLSLDAFIKDQELNGYETLNLNNCFMDPTFMRERIAYRIFRRYMPACQTGYVELYLNEEYWGLYVIVEQINKDFISQWFDEDEGNLYKGDPRGTLQWYGENPDQYTRNYEKKTNEEINDWSDLIELIDTLNHSQNLINSFPALMNYDRTLWYLALCNILVNLDSYINSGHNYYLYHNPQTDRFSIIPWDLNEIFGCFPPQGFSETQFENYSPYTFTDQLPLLKNLLTHDFFRNIYTAHYKSILQDVFHPDTVWAWIEDYKNLIYTSVENDTKKLYTLNQFEENLTNSVTIEGNRLAPGIYNFIDHRRNYLLSLNEFNQISAVFLAYEIKSDSVFKAGTTNAISCRIESDTIDQVLFFFRFQPGVFEWVTMENHSSNQWIAEFEIPLEQSGQQIEFYFLAQQNNSSVTLYPEKAQIDLFCENISGSLANSAIVINEFMADNEQLIEDPHGEFSDWIELFNRSNFPVNLNGMSITDDPNQPDQFVFPEMIMEPGQYLILWADGSDSSANDIHLNFKLDKDGEYIGLYDPQGETMDAYHFEEQQPDISEGRYPNGVGPFQFLNFPTPGSENILETSISNSEKLNTDLRVSSVYPNPFRQNIHIEFEIKQNTQVKIDIYNLLGQKIKQLCNPFLSCGKHHFQWKLDQISDEALPNGIYFFKISTQETTLIRKSLLIQ